MIPVSKKHNKRRKNQKLFEYGFYALIAVLVVVLAVQIFTPKPAPVDNTELYISGDGHVHLGDGSHVGSVEEMFGEVEYEVTEDGHVHTKDGIHIGTYLGDAAAE